VVFATPALLLALAALPLLWWLLRVTPPAPRMQDFPAIRLLAGLKAREETAARTPPWVLILRMIAAALLIVGLAGPVLDAAGALPGGSGTLLLVMDDGWAAAPDWAARERAAGAVLDRAERAGRRVSLLTTVRTEMDAPPQATPATPAPELRPLLAALRPKPWPPNRTEAAQAARASGATASVWIADGVGAAGDAALGASLTALGPVETLRPETVKAWLMRAPRALADRLVARVSALPQPASQDFAVLAQTGDGRTLARAAGTVAPGADAAEASIALPAELRNQLARLVLAGVPSAGAVALLDEGARRRPVGLVTAERGDDQPLLGLLYYVKRALAGDADVREGSLKALLAQPLAVIVLADEPVGDEDAAALARWVEHGGLLLRFAGPRLAAATSDSGSDTDRRDPLLPVPLLAGDRRLGGALSWTEPAHLAPFPAGSPFAGLPVPAEVTVSRQVLAEPSAQVAGRTWAALADGTPLVTAEASGAGRIVLFHVTANAEWSDLPLSGLFPAMLQRLVALSAGVETPPGSAVLSPTQALDGFGELGPVPPAATGLAADRFSATVPGPRHPPGFYGPSTGQQALNLGTTLPVLAPLALPGGASVQALTAGERERPLSGPLIAAALILLAFDLLVSLRLRGLLRIGAAASVLLLLAGGPAHAADSPALTTRLAYLVTGDSAVDQVSRSGLRGLSDYVNQRTAAALGSPAGVVPGQDDLSVYPLLYWPIIAGTTLPGPAIAALNDFMAHGGIILVDTRGGSGSGEGFAPGTDAALRQVAGSGGLAVPPLAPLTDEHVLAHAFYLLRDFPGRFDGGTVWVARDKDLGNDSVSPIVIGGNDWAAAWAVDAAGDHPYATIPGGDRQRTLSYRFGVNLVMYALTGNYKGDQVHVPAILERLGQ
jgi:hypothetical protein